MRGLHHTSCDPASAASPSYELCSTSLHPLIAQISSQTQQCGGRTEERCLVEADPSLQERLSSALATLRDSAEDSAYAEADLAARLRIQLERTNKPIGMDDGLIIPGREFPLGTSVQTVRNAAADRAPLRGTVNIVVVLVEFSDRKMDARHTREYFEQLFFSTGVLLNGSVKEYFDEVTHGMIQIEGQVVGPHELQRPLSEYAHGESGTGLLSPNARTMARDAALAADPEVDFAPYDNDGNGYVDAFIVIHAGRGAEQTGNTEDIWSHKWTLPGGPYTADTTRIYGYLTVPEDCRIGVCCHELGHLLFGWPDLYDTDYSSRGLGNWCLMAGGSWNGGGDIPAHPSAWCKVQQDWVSVSEPTTNTTINIADVKDGQTVYYLWKDGGPSNEYFLVENRQRRLFDQRLPGDGLLIYHVDESIPGNANETHPKVALMQADGDRDLEQDVNRGDTGDPYPGSSNNTIFNATSTPNSKSYGGIDTCVRVTDISPSAAVMSARLSVTCGLRRRIPGGGRALGVRALEARVSALEAAVQGLLTAQSAGSSMSPAYEDQTFIGAEPDPDLSQDTLSRETGPGVSTEPSERGNAETDYE
jgi:immune inhibitor A